MGQEGAQALSLRLRRNPARIALFCHPALVQEHQMVAELSREAFPV